jgi:hypothetical protein
MSESSTLIDPVDLALLEPLMITQDGTILAGHAQLESARKQGLLSLSCIEYELTEAEALQWILRKQLPSKGLNAFSRILLALDLESWFREKARANQQAGGRSKVTSNLTEADRLDVRREIASAAGVSVGNVTKVKQLTAIAHGEVLQALLRSEISIHRAWLWSKESQYKQLAELRRCRDIRTTNKIKRLISRHKPKGETAAGDPCGVIKRLGGLDSNDLATIRVAVVRGPAKAIFLTEDLLRSLPQYQEQVPL